VVVELKRRIENAKGTWAKELLEVLWAYRCIPHNTIGKLPFNLTYGSDVMLQVEIREPTICKQIQNMNLKR